MTQRVQIQQQGDVAVYSVGIWPGWGDIIAVGVGVLVISAMLGGLFFFTGLIDFSSIAGQYRLT